MDARSRGGFEEAERAEREKEREAEERRRRLARDKHVGDVLFDELDRNGDGVLTHEELRPLLASGKVTEADLPPGGLSRGQFHDALRHAEERRAVEEASQATQTSAREDEEARRRAAAAKAAEEERKKKEEEEREERLAAARRRRLGAKLVSTAAAGLSGGLDLDDGPEI